ncbi:TlpA disulfide reductase family protein [Dyella sp. C9]|uniref:TlpA disulfide reductase family protein n=1 Tax=Dyella sp. C9 TaxID=2202154 RepID=UPI001300BDB4|nr:TlpA disulfide reductase family protein [Dyella sp. C9]
MPFHFELQNGAHGLVGRFFNGSDPVPSDAARVEGNHLVLRYDAFDRVLDLQAADDGTLSGTYTASTGSTKAAPWKIVAHRAQASARPDDGAPNIDGLWILPAESKKKNEYAWRLITHQDFGKLSASILRVGGDTGALTGIWKDGQWSLSNFSGTRAAVASIRPAHDSNGYDTLDVTLSDAHGGTAHYTAYRPDTARKLGLPDAADLTTHTGVRDPDEPFAFGFKDLDGRLVSNTDARFRGKVVLVDVSGSWCPNCHDEAPFLDALYRKYHARGLEIVTVDFEDAEEYADPARLRAFVARYKPPFPVLLAGTTDQVAEKLPQAVNLDSWPTTFFIARDGRVEHVHTGFSAPATGDFHAAIESEFESQIEALLVHKAP